MKTAEPTDWKTEKLPSKNTTIRLERTFSRDEMELIRRGLIPQQMEDKWFIYWKDGDLFFHRSWTGYCVFIVHFVEEGEGFRMAAAEANREPEQYKETDDAKDGETISYLIDLLLLGKEPEFPADEASPEKKALMNWSLVGRAMLGKDADEGGVIIIKKKGLAANHQRNEKGPPKTMTLN